MREQLDFYFDFMSPFAYLAFQKMPELAKRYELDINYHVIDLPAAKKAAGNTGPRNVDIPPKIRYLKTDLDRWAHRYGVPLKFPPSLNSTRMNIGTFYATDRGVTEAYIRQAWAFCWGAGGDLDSNDGLSSIATSMGWDPNEFLGFVGSASAGERYNESNSAAQHRGVFGVPTMMFRDQMWWGNDRLDFMCEYLDAHVRPA